RYRWPVDGILLPQSPPRKIFPDGNRTAPPRRSPDNVPPIFNPYCGAALRISSIDKETSEYTSVRSSDKYAFAPRIVPMTITSLVTGKAGSAGVWVIGRLKPPASSSSSLGGLVPSV